MTGSKQSNFFPSSSTSISCLVSTDTESVHLYGKFPLKAFQMFVEDVFQGPSFCVFRQVSELYFLVAAHRSTYINCNAMTGKLAALKAFHWKVIGVSGVSHCKPAWFPEKRRIPGKVRHGRTTLYQKSGIFSQTPSTLPTHLSKKPPFSQSFNYFLVITAYRWIRKDWWRLNHWL